jgi:hypothetical protein
MAQADHDERTMKLKYGLWQNLDQLENYTWPDAQDSDTGLVKRCTALRRKPLQQYTIEDLRVMIGQKFGLEFLIPLALERLQDDPLASGDCYPGDLLAATMRVNVEYWSDHLDQQEILDSIVSNLSELPPYFEREIEAYQIKMATLKANQQDHNKKKKKR